jgi:hypothetical protein
MAAAPNTTDDRPAGITCEKYVRGEGKRCRHYLSNGGCALPDELMCVEWLKANGHRVPASPPAEQRPKDLFGNPVAEKPAPRSAARSLPVVSESPRDPEATVASETPAAIDVDQLRGFTSEDIASFKALGVEVCLHSEAYGELWLVPAYTGRPRKEITPEHAATVMRVLSVFPGSRVTAFEKTTPDEPAKEGSPA